MKAKDLLCYLNFAEACMIHVALNREINSGLLTPEATTEAKAFVKAMEDEKQGYYTIQSAPAHHIVP